MTFYLTDESQDWFADILANHYAEARKRAFDQLAKTIRTPTGCLVTPTTSRRKVRFHGRQTTAYRFVLCVLTRTAPGLDTVVRHLCHNDLCINPDHLEFGTMAENKRDDWEKAAYGVDFDLL